METSPKTNGPAPAPKDNLSTARRRWTWVFVVLVLLAYVVPFTVLSGVHKIYGAFLFWTLFAVVSIACMIVITGNWRDLS